MRARLLEFPVLVVSCQAREDNPLHGPAFMRAMSLAALEGGAGAIRANGADDIAAIRSVTSAPIIGLFKRELPGSDVYITPDLESARLVAEAGADIVALDATSRPRPREPLEEVVRGVRAMNRLVFADCATLEDAVRAEELGADYVGTTLAGYTRETEARKGEGPDLDLLAAVVGAVRVPVVAEGRFWTPEEVARAFEIGASGVVVGTAITNPREVTRRFARAVPR